MLQDHINKECVVHSEVHIRGWNAPTQTVGIFLSFLSSTLQSLPPFYSSALWENGIHLSHNHFSPIASTLWRQSLAKVSVQISCSVNTRPFTNDHERKEKSIVYTDQFCFLQAIKPLLGQRKHYTLSHDRNSNPQACSALCHRDSILFLPFIKFVF